MRTTKSRLAATAAALMLGAGLVIGTAAPAAAATTCAGGLLGNWSIDGGYIAVYYDSSTGNNCSMTYTNNPGVKQYIMASIAVGSKEVKQSGQYSYYAGPVTIYGKGSCVSFAGQVAGNPEEFYANKYCG